MDLTIGTSGEAAPPTAKRRVRNYLIDTTLQLRLAAYLVAVAGTLCAALGWMLWSAYQETSRVVALSSPDAGDALASLFADGDRARIVLVAGALAVVLLLLLVSAVVVTHRIAGPAFALRRACREIAAGGLASPRPLRSGDLLQDLADDFAGMVEALRAREAQEREAIVRAAAALRAPDATPAARAAAAALLERLATEKDERLAP
jgi:methyl-accepting chemotaxis protein